MKWFAYYKSTALIGLQIRLSIWSNDGRKGVPLSSNYNRDHNGPVIKILLVVTFYTNLHVVLPYDQKENATQVQEIFKLYMLKY